MQPIQAAIESLHAKSLCPRLHVDVTHADAVCPDFVVEKWKQRLVIDLDPSYPLELAFTDVGVEADLSFGGYVTRCTFPWAAIYVVADRATGRGQVFSDNVPAALREAFGLPPAPASLDKGLTEVRDDPNAPKGNRRRKRRGAATAEPAGPREVIRAIDDEADDDDDREPSDDPPEAVPEARPPAAEDAAKARRSAFKVIDGGG